ncbi:hypothetical protein MKZ17_19230 [Solibacillus sp. FSL R7-0682]|uniref:hypothetical protein n=1 Tax=Solibacillus sp. FSL R7-0682 TaxID=2921690 RepID=UPI0030F5F1A7
MKMLFNFFLYFLYLIAAELPLFIIFLIRADPTTDLYIYLKILLLISIALNILILLIILLHKPKPKFNETITVTNNKIGRNSISDFFSFFLLPFFTFSINSSADPNKFLLEMLILFILLTIYLFRTNNLTANILIFLLFNIYDVKSKGNHFTLFTFVPTSFDSFDSTKKIIKISRKYYIYIGDEYNKFRIILLTISILYLISFSLLFYYI